ncbi:hypothetical protein [Nannocystis radixulma]|uniref:Secreted protein n=1 Tax=Nannocystis radixulma TaxID=2995305 RepID=A0ABT5AXS8_9BACT|nr:hypothetical protein [Nannocystis radixulma]MDC0666643.1 hypothetical protein [Nannocystis radixulma]
MSKIFSALLLALSLTATVACDDPDDKNVERNDTGDESTTGEDDTTTGEGPEVQTTSAGTTDDEKNPGCLNSFNLPPTGGPAGTLGDKC